MKIELGKEAKDKVTGFKGIIIGKAEYLYGCTQYCLKPQVDKDGKPVDSAWFDDGRLAIIGPGITSAEVKGTKAGGPNSDAPRI